MRGKLFRLLLTAWFGVWAVDAQLPTGCASGQGSMSMASMAMGGHHSTHHDDDGSPGQQQSNQCHQHCSVQSSRVALLAPAVLAAIGAAGAPVAAALSNHAIPSVAFPHAHPFSTAPPSTASLSFLI